MSDGAPQFTAEERGESRPLTRGVGRIVVSVVVAALVVAIILAGNFLDVGRFLPWAPSPPQPTSEAVAGASVPTTAPTDAATAPDATPTPTATLSAADHLSAQDLAFAAVSRMDAADPALASTGIVVLEPPQMVFTLADLIARGAVRQDDATTYTLTRVVFVRGGAELAIDAPGATLRMSSQPGMWTSITGWNGLVSIRGAEGAPVTVVGWDEAAAAPDTDADDGRAFIRVRDGALTAQQARFEHLGYWSGRTGGLAVTATEFGLAALKLEATEHVGMHYGLFVSGASAGSVTAARITDSRMSGIEVTGGTQNLVLDRVEVDGAATSGLHVDRASGALTVTNSRFSGAGQFGIDVNGAPLADGPSAGGGATTRAKVLAITDTTAEKNHAGAVRTRQMDDVTLTRLTAEARATAVRVDGPSSGLTVDGSILTSAEERGLLIDDGVAAARVVGSTITGKRIALEVVDSEIEISNNTLRVDAGHAVEVSAGTRADIVGNTLIGAGQDAVSVRDGSRTAQRDTATDQWTPQIAAIVWLNDHPMMWMWSLVLLLPLVGLLFIARRRRTHRELRELLERAIVRHGASQLAAYEGAETVDAGRAPVAEDDGAPEPETARRPDPSYVFTGSISTTAAVAPKARGTHLPASVATPPSSGSRPRTAPRSFSDLRVGALAEREFSSLQEFAIAAVVEAGYPIGTIARLFRVPSWKLEQWVREMASEPASRR